MYCLKIQICKQKIISVIVTVWHVRSNFYCLKLCIREKINFICLSFAHILHILYICFLAPSWSPFRFLLKNVFISKYEYTNYQLLFTTLSSFITYSAALFILYSLNKKFILFTVYSHFHIILDTVYNILFWTGGNDKNFNETKNNVKSCRC